MKSGPTHATHPPEQLALDALSAPSGSLLSDQEIYLLAPLIKKMHPGYIKKGSMPHLEHSIVITEQGHVIAIADKYDKNSDHLHLLYGKLLRIGQNIKTKEWLLVIDFVSRDANLDYVEIHEGLSDLYAQKRMIRNQIKELVKLKVMSLETSNLIHHDIRHSQFFTAFQKAEDCLMDIGLVHPSTALLNHLLDSLSPLKHYDYPYRYLKDLASKEAKVLKRVNRLYDTFETFVISPFTFGVPLNQYIKKNPNLSFDDRIKIALSLSKEMLQLQEEYRVIHRDLKPTNIIVSDETMQAKLIDFTLSILENEAERRGSSRVGTPKYYAPELKPDANGLYSFLSDNYAIGMMLNLIFTQDSLTDLKTIQPIWLQEMIKGLLESDPEKRMTMESVVLRLEKNST